MLLDQLLKNFSTTNNAKVQFFTGAVDFVCMFVAIIESKVFVNCKEIISYESCERLKALVSFCVRDALRYDGLF